MLTFFTKTKLYFFTISTFLFLSSFFVCNAQSSDIYITISPNNPRSGESINISVNSNIVDLNSSKIIWYIDGAPRRETTNKNIVIKAKSDGSKTSIKVVVETIDGITKEAFKEIYPAAIDLIIEPMSYTLPFYKGKPYLAGQGSVRIIALPDILINGEKPSLNNLYFKWSNNNIVLGSLSGKGKNTIKLDSSIPIRDINIGIQILDENNNVLAENSKVIFIDNPQILLYENNALYGILYNKAISDYYFLGTREELKIIAKPFSFSFNKDSESDANYLWYVNSNYVPPSGKINEIVLRQTSTSLRGVASINLDVKNKNKINQFAKTNFNIEFGQ